MTKWIAAAAVLVVALVATAVAGRVVRKLCGAPGRPEALQSAANAIASLVSSAVIVVGLVVALGIISPDLLADLPAQLVTYLPKVLAAAILVVGGKAVAGLAEVAVGRSLGRAPAATQRRAAMAVRFGILGMAGLLATSQVGIDTTVVNLAVAAAFFGAAATFTLLVGLGGRDVAAEVAAARSLRRVVSVGDRVTVGAVSGRVVAVHPTAVEVQPEDGAALLVPPSELLRSTIIIERSQPPAGPGE